MIKMDKKERNKQEANLIADFEMEYGNEDNWSDEVKKDFETKWKEIQLDKTIKISELALAIHEG